MHAPYIDKVCATMSSVQIIDDRDAYVFWWGHDGQPKARHLRTDRHVVGMWGIPFISFGELCLVVGHETDESATIARIGDGIAPVDCFLSSNVHVSRLPDGDEIVSCVTYDNYYETTVVYRISAKDRTYKHVQSSPQMFVDSNYLMPFVYSVDMQKVIAAQPDLKYGSDLIAPIIPSTIAIGGDMFTLRRIYDTRDNRALLQAVMQSVHEDGSVGYSADIHLLEYNLRTHESAVIAEIDDLPNNAAYVAQNIVVVTMVRTSGPGRYRLYRSMINLADMTRYLVSDDIVCD